jgi:DTW domain-containing protein YfiP
LDAWQAKAIYKHTPSLRKATRVQFSKDAGMKGGYEFRKEPKDNFLSTLESIAYCLTGAARAACPASHAVLCAPCPLRRVRGAPL